MHIIAPVLRELGWLTGKEMLNYHDCIMFYIIMLLLLKFIREQLDRLMTLILLHAELQWHNDCFLLRGKNLLAPIKKVT